MSNVKAISISGLIGITLCTLVVAGMISIFRANLISDCNIRDRARLKLVTSAYQEIYAKTGVLYTSLTEFENSSYYPFQESYWSSAMAFRYKGSHRRLDTKIRNTHGGIKFDQLFIEASKSTRVNVCRCPGQVDEPAPIPKKSNAEITKIRAELYSSGVPAVTEHFKSIRMLFLDDSFGSTYNTAYENHLNERPLPSCSVVDLPKTKTELKAYTDWLKELWNTDELVDGEGRPFVFSIRNGRLVVQEQK